MSGPSALLDEHISQLGRWRIPIATSAHNGEINTLRGNVNWMHARQAVLSSPLFGDDLKKVFPVIAPGKRLSELRQRTRTSFPRGTRLATCHGHAHPGSMGWPPAHEGRQARVLRISRASLMEPWDGPAAIAFTDGRVIGATLDRNGLRPGRYVVTRDGLVVLRRKRCSRYPAAADKDKGRRQPGKMFLVDTVEGRIVSDKKIKKRLVSRQPYSQWLRQNQIMLEKLPEPIRVHESDHETILCRQRAFGYSAEDLSMILERWPARARNLLAAWATTPRSLVYQTSLRAYSTISSNSSRKSRTHPSIPFVKKW